MILGKPIPDECKWISKEAHDASIADTHMYKLEGLVPGVQNLYVGRELKIYTDGLNIRLKLISAEVDAIQMYQQSHDGHGRTELHRGMSGCRGQFPHLTARVELLH